MSAHFIDALRACADDPAPIYARREEFTEVSEYEAGRRAGYDDALDDAREAMIEALGMPAQLVASVMAIVRKRGVAQ